MTTTHVRAHDTEERWLLYDATEHTLGRMAAVIAVNLMGKDRPTFTFSEGCNTHVVVINAAKARLTSKKQDEKEYQHYTGYASGRKVVSINRVRERRPTDIVTLAVRRMLPKSRLGHDMLRNLKVYGGDDHPHSPQSPVKVDSL
ncbi:MAG: large subunit ribosomal protein L13 [Planctomycetota bacterium]|jgi:large subunit ribosomal protein L13